MSSNFKIKCFKFVKNAENWHYKATFSETARQAEVKLHVAHPMAKIFQVCENIGN